MASHAEDLADSTDWLKTPLSGLAPLESSLRCQVCKDFYTTPMMTSCSHTFCSLCIRRYLSQEGKCPACRENDQEIKLRRNWVVEELVTNFKKERAGLLQAARSMAELLDSASRPKKRRRISQDNGSIVNGHVASDDNRRSTRSQSRRNASQTQGVSESEHSRNILDQDEVMDTDEGSVFEEPQTGTGNHNHEPHDGLVSCPCCGKRMKEAIINSHLDSCIAGGASTPKNGASVGVNVTSPPAGSANVNRANLLSQTQSKPPKQREHLPFINYSLFNDTKLRRKLAELGIPSNGSKELMRKRHTEWVNLWNANCDSRSPVSKGQLLEELTKWERTMGRQIDQPPSLAGGSVMAKDFDRDEYVRTQKSNFDDLIAMARKSRPASVGPAGSSASTPVDGANDDKKSTVAAIQPGQNARTAIVEHFQRNNEDSGSHREPLDIPQVGNADAQASQEAGQPAPQRSDPDASAPMPMSWLMPMSTPIATRLVPVPSSVSPSASTSTSPVIPQPPLQTLATQQLRHTGSDQQPPLASGALLQPASTYEQSDSYIAPSEFDDYARPQYRGGGSRLPHFR